jgi:hypothetical protein
MSCIKSIAHGTLRKFSVVFSKLFATSLKAWSCLRWFHFVVCKIILLFLSGAVHVHQMSPCQFYEFSSYLFFLQEEGNSFSINWWDLSSLRTRPIWHYFAQGQRCLPCLLLIKYLIMLLQMSHIVGIFSQTATVIWPCGWVTHLLYLMTMWHGCCSWHSTKVASKALGKLL